MPESLEVKWPYNIKNSNYLKIHVRRNNNAIFLRAYRRVLRCYGFSPLGPHCVTF